MKKSILTLFFALFLLSLFDSLGQSINIDGKWKLDVMRDTTGTMIDFVGEGGDPHFYKNLVIKKNKVILSHYDSKKIKGTFKLNNEVLQIFLKNKTLEYRIKIDDKNNLILEEDLLTMDNSTFKILGYYKKI